MNKIEQRYGKILLPLITPFHRKGEDIHYEAASQLIEHIISTRCCDSIIVTGTTGEFNTLMASERISFLRFVFDQVNGRVPLIAGTGAASTKEAEIITKEAQNIGYELAMIVAPYYCRPTQKGILDHYVRIAASVQLDILLYNIPIFTGVNIDPDTVQILSKMERIVGIKDEAGINPTQMTEYKRAACKDFAIYNGDDIMVLCGLIQGACGVVSGGSHLIGQQMRQMIEFFDQGRLDEAQQIHHQLDPFFKNLTQNGRTNPIPILKAAVEMLDIPVGPPRMPLDEATENEKEIIRAELVRLSVI